PNVKQAVNQASVSIGNLSEILVQVPSLEAQGKIARALDHVEELRARRRQAIYLLDDLAQSVFLDMFGDPATNPKELPTRPLGSFGKVVTGNTPPRADAENYGDAIEWIKS